MNESEKQFSLTRAALSTGGRAKKQIPISSRPSGQHRQQAETTLTPFPPPLDYRNGCYSRIGVAVLRQNTKVGLAGCSQFDFAEISEMLLRQ